MNTSKAKNTTNLEAPVERRKPKAANKIMKAMEAVGSTSAMKSYYCDVCKVKCTSKAMLASHLCGKKHITRAGKKVKTN